MRVLHVVTWVDDGNPFGGPVTVATNQVAELVRQGVEAEIVSAGRSSGSWSSGENHPTVRRFRGFRILPKRAGFSGIASPHLWFWIARNASRYEVVHVHVSRDLVTMPAALLASLTRTKVVLQPHGMIDSSSRRSAHALDLVLTRLLFRRAAMVLSLTPNETRELVMVTGIDPERVVQFPNGIGPSGVSVGRLGGHRIRVVFCSRLHPRKRPILFLRAANALLADGLEAEFVLAGPDEGEGRAVDEELARLLPNAVTRLPPLDRGEVAELLASASALVLPSINEPYPMIVLEAMEIGVPVVITESCGLAGFVREHGAGVVIANDDLAALTRAIKALVEDPRLVHEMGSRGRSAVRAELAIASVIERLRGIYDSKL